MLSTSFLTFKLMQNIFSAKNQQNITLTLLDSFKEKEPPFIEATDKTIIDQWLKSRLDIIKHLPPKEVINILMHLIEDPEVNYLRSTSMSIKDLAEILSVFNTRATLPLTTTNNKDLTKYLKHLINKTMLNTFIDNHIIDNFVAENIDKIDIAKLIKLIDQLLYIRKSLDQNPNTLDQRYGKDAVDALEFLINKKKLSVVDAFLEIKPLSYYQLDALIKLYDDGMRAKHLLTFQADNKNSVYFSYKHTHALSYLMKERYLTAAEAMLEVNGLSEEQAEALKDQYHLGLRGKHLRSWQAGRYAAFGETLAKTLKYLITEQKLNPEQAITELNELTYEKCEALKTLYDIGLRGDALRKMPHFHKDALVSLVKEQHVPLEVAVSELTLIGDHRWYADTLAQLYKNGLRSEHLLKYKSPWGRESNFSSDHYNYLTYLIRDEKLSPDQAIKEINMLSREAVEALTALYQYGLRGSHVRYWNHDTGGYNHSRCWALIVLVRDKEQSIDSALSILQSIDCSLALTALAKEYRYKPKAEETNTSDQMRCSP